MHNKGGAENRICEGSGVQEGDKDGGHVENGNNPLHGPHLDVVATGGAAHSVGGRESENREGAVRKLHNTIWGILRLPFSLLTNFYE